ncbi:59.7-kDa protein [Tetterwort vein chlorosis virus]|uniref:59.7-kDa protein n=1 Tax=Tetterwort vein chlorosis virus TaxID=1712389 RepID=A0A0M4LY14_9CLOS|nr:59.7-kDa protein [Tetterwort vein chlorosis virus]ALE18221.1 59.7-kDa protein [Tetterwort vein chlorosis virus]
MVSIMNNPQLLSAFQLLFKISNVEEKLRGLNDYMLQNVSKENNNVFTAISGRNPMKFDSTFTKRSGDVYFDKDDGKSIVKLILIYFYNVEPSLLTKTGYKPESFFISDDWRASLLQWKKYIDKSMNDFLSDNKDIGCTYTEDNISKHYPNQSKSRLITLYRVCNSQNRLIPLQEFLEGKVKGFEINPKADVEAIGEGFSNNNLFRECVECFKDYMLLSSSQSGRAKVLVVKKFFDTYIDSLVGNQLMETVRDNPLVLAKFVKDFDEFTAEGHGFSNNFKAIEKLDKNFQKFCKDVFKLSTSLDRDTLFVKLPKDSVVDILGQPIILSNFIRRSSIPKPISNSSSLPHDIDICVSEGIVDFLKQFGIEDKVLILDTMLFVFAAMTTNKKIWNTPNKVSFSVDGKKISFLTTDFTGFIINLVRRFDPNYDTNNIIRQWANLRGNRALALFRMTGFKPQLFSTVPGILPWMRFDFFKLLSQQDLTDEEVQSLHTLRLMTEWKSNNSTFNEKNLLRWISRN